MYTEFQAARFEASLTMDEVHQLLGNLVREWGLRVASENGVPNLVRFYVTGSIESDGFQKSKEVAAGRIQECNRLIWERLNNAPRQDGLVVEKIY